MERKSCSWKKIRRGNNFTDKRKHNKSRLITNKTSMKGNAQNYNYMLLLKSIIC